MALAAGDENLRILRRHDLSSSAYETTIQNFLVRQKVDCRFSREKLQFYNEIPPSICDRDMSLCRFVAVFGPPPTSLFFPVDHLTSKMFEHRIKESMSESFWSAYNLVRPLQVQAAGQ